MERARYPGRQTQRVTVQRVDLGEIIIHDRHLTATEIEAVEEDLALRYGVGDRPRRR